MAEEKVEKPKLEVEEFDFVTYERSAGWYVILVAAALALAGMFYWQQNWSGTIFVVSALVLFLIISKTKPRKIKTAFYDSGVVVDNKVYRYDELKSFHFRLGDIPKIVFERPGFLGRLIIAPMDAENIEQVVAEVKKHLTQGDDQGEDIVDRVNRLMKF